MSKGFDYTRLYSFQVLVISGLPHLHLSVFDIMNCQQNCLVRSVPVFKLNKSDSLMLVGVRVP